MEKTNSNEGPVIAILQNIIHDGGHGPYGVATAEDSSIEGSITFSLNENDNVWSGERLPSKSDLGCRLVLEDITSKRPGWRANKARFYRPSDIKKV